MDQQKRLLVAIALSFGLTLLFTQFVWKPQADAEAARLAALDAGASVALVDAGGKAGEGPVPVVAAVDADGGAVLDADGGVVAVAPPPKVELPLRELEVERQTSSYRFTTEGAGLTAAVLKGRREREEQRLTIAQGYQKLFGKTFDPPPQMDLARPIPGVAPQLAVSIAGASPLKATARYAVTEEAPGKLVFTTTDGPWEVTKTFTFTDAPPSDKDPTGYVSQLEVKVRNVGAQSAAGELLVSAVRAIDPEHEQAPSMFGGIGNQASVLCGHGDDVKRKTPDNDKPREEETGPLHFVAIDQQYFLSALWPLSGAVDGKCVLTATTTARSAEFVLPLTLGAGESVTKSFGVFLGPKEIDLLQNIGKQAAQPGQTITSFSPGLDKTVDFGWWAVICKALIVFLRFFHSLVGNWGLAIILLTVLVKVVLLPLTHRAMVSAEQMKKLQPRLEEIRKKYPDDREKQNLEMMKLYQEAKVNPLGGCLPLLLQLPIWAALFTTLRTSYELYGEPFFGVWSDLTSKDPTYLMPLALGVTMIITQRLQPQMMDKSQAFMMTWVMPVFFTAIMMNYPAGLALYIFTNNLLSIVQQYALRRYLTAKGQLTVKPAGSAK
ncbi:MAG: membrane protein insertase YidC [Myxococcota bacterium]|jgi:YidC/Oxa1 family membrane protein insertase